MIKGLSKEQLYFYNLKKKELMGNFLIYKNKYGSRYQNVIDNEAFRYAKSIKIGNTGHDDSCPCCGE